jgi:Spy/CpxP family protein refolding chaperone
MAMAKLLVSSTTGAHTMRKSLIRLALAGAAVTALAAGAASAQIPAPPPPPAPPAPPPPPMDAMMAMGPGMMMMHHGRDLDPAKRADHLRDVLQLRPDQDGALKAYVEATSPKIVVRKDNDDDKPGEKMDRLVDRKPPTTLERLDQMSKAAEAMQKRVAATRAFYTALSPSQQKAFDALDLERGGDHVFVRRFETRGATPSKGGERRVIIQRKVG